MLSFLRSCRNAFTIQQNNNIIPERIESTISTMNPISTLIETHELSTNLEISTMNPIIQNIVENIHEQTKSEEQAMFELLTNKSKRRTTPEGVNITLLNHQEAMFERCVVIESNNCKAEMIVKNEERYMVNPITGKRLELPDVGPVSIGILNDKPGAGKTFVLLSLLQNDPGTINQANIICVPQNIFAQWKYSIETFFPKDCNKFEMKYIDSYASVLDLYSLYDLRRSNIQRRPRLFLVNDGFIESVAQTIIDININVHRYIIDEIDSIQNRLYTPFFADFVWLVSASFIFKGKSLVGPFQFNPKDISNIVCKCNEDFVNENIKLPEPIIEQIICQDNEIQLIKSFVSFEILQGLNTYDYRPFIKFLKKSFHPNKHTLFELCEMFRDSLKTSQEEIDCIQQEIDKIENETKDTIIDSNEYLDKLRFEVIEKTFQLNNYNELNTLFETYKESKLEETKDFKFKVNLFERIQSDNTKKWLIFNDNSASLNEQATFLQSNKVKCVMLDGGNSKKVEKAIHEFKNGDIQVLLLNSVLEGAGMNLENADYLVFMHKTRPRLVKQVLGRAQRFGRTTPLTIIELFNKNEVEILLEDDDLAEIQTNQYVIDHKF
jgi:hypothetical protein